MLVQAQRQQNVPGQIAIDAVPRTGRVLIKNGNSQAANPAEAAPNLFTVPTDDDSADSAAANNSENDDDQDLTTDNSDNTPPASLADRPNTAANTAANPATDPVARPQDSSESRFPFLEKLFR